MSYVIMAIQEEGSEIRISDWDEHSRGFNTQDAAYRALDKAREEFIEYRQFWVEELKDASYWRDYFSKYDNC